MRRLAALTLLMTACGLDESGLMPRDGSTTDASADVGQSDAPRDVVNEVPPSCTTLDVSSCADSGIPDGWAPVVTTDAGACPTTKDYASPSAYVDNLGTSGPCACGCTPSGSIACAGTLEWVNSSNCTFGTPTVIDGGGAGCYNLGGGYDFSFKPLTYSAKGFSVGCDAGEITTPSVTSGQVTACAPQCTADYCHVGAAFNRCIWSATQTTCPPPFVNQDTIGKETDTTVACGCACKPRQVGVCSATVSLFQNNDTTCSTTPFLDASVTVGGQSCNNTGGNQVGSFEYRPGPSPTVACDADGGSAPSVTFGATQMTVCCLP